jgi:cell division protein FtsB
MKFTSDYKYIVLSGVFVLASIGFARTSISIMKSKKRVEVIKDEVAYLEKKRMLLQEDLDYQKTPAFIEQEARNKLNMVKPKEEVFVVNENLTNDINKSFVLSASTRSENYSDTKKANVYAWLRLLF